MTNDEYRMTNASEADAESATGVVKYDLEARTAAFAERVIDFAAQLDRNPVSLPLISQLVRSATSIGANYCEADDAETKRDFSHKIGLCRKEARETKYWFRMIARALPASKQDARPLWQEAKELHLIFSKIRRTAAK
jgi:four helix bundle protein